MNVVTTINKLEQGLVAAYDESQAKLPGDAAPRRAAIARFEASGLPHRRIEEWKYTDLRNMLKEVSKPLATSAEAANIAVADVEAVLQAFAGVDGDRIVFVDGHHQAQFKRLDETSVEMATVGAKLLSDPSSADELLAAEEATYRGNAVVDLNTAFATDGVLLDVAPGAILSKPILIVHIAAASEPVMRTTRHKLKFGAKCQATVVEVYVRLPDAADTGLINTTCEVEIGDGATVSHVKSVFGCGRIDHLANWHVTLGGEANYRAFHFTSESGVTRSEAIVQFRGEGSNLDFSGAFLGRNKDHIDTTLFIEHLEPHCASRELFKGVLDDQARGIFQAKVLVAQKAQKTDGKQMAQALMLSADAEFDSKPELEIYADDVLCGHGSTSAQLDDDLLFYLQSRGIPKQQARAMLIESFVGEALDCVEHDAIRDALTEIANNWLAKIA